MNSDAQVNVDTLSMPLLRKVWLTSIFLVLVGVVTEAAYDGVFGQDWLYRMLLLAALPLVMVDRLAILRSQRAREILGPRFWVYAANAFGAYWTTLMVFIAWPSLGNFQWGFTIWAVGGAGVGLFEARRHKVQMPDLADQCLDLEKFESGNWFIRTGYIWWVPAMAIVILGMVWSKKDGIDVFSKRYILMQMFVLLALFGIHPHRKLASKSKMYWTGLAGTGLFLIAIFAD